MKYRDKLEFIEQTTISDGAGGVTVTGTTTVYTCWGLVKSKGVSRTLQDAMIRHNCSYEITLPYQFAFKPAPKQQIKFNGLTLVIHGLPDVREREKEIKILAYV